MASDAEYGLRAIKFSAIAAVACSAFGYLAAKQLLKPFAQEAARHRGAMLFTGLALGAVLLAGVYSMFMLYRGSARTKLLAMMALVIAFGGSYGGWTLGWMKAGNPSAIKAF